MADLVLQVDRTSGNYETQFSYTMDVSFSGMVGAIENAEIRMLIPSQLQVTLGAVGDLVEEVRETQVATGTEIRFLFGRMEELGAALRLGFTLQYTLDAESGASFVCAPTLYINGTAAVTAQSAAVTLLVQAAFRFTREILLPGIAPAGGSEVYWKGVLQNVGDLGAGVGEITLTCVGGEDMVLDADFPVLGYDTSTRFGDESLDGQLGRIADNVLTMTLSLYRGERYEFIYKTRLRDLPAGTVLTTEDIVSIGTEAATTQRMATTLGEALSDASISLYGPDYALPLSPICYEVSVQNKGNRALAMSTWECALPEEVRFLRLETGALHIGALKENVSAMYTLRYETRQGMTGQLGVFSSDGGQSVDLAPLYGEDDSLAALIWEFGAMGVGVETRVPMALFGELRADVSMSEVLQLDAMLRFSDGEGMAEREAAQRTLVEDICVLAPSLSATVGRELTPGDVFSLQMRVNCRRSRLQNPILAVLLPPQLQYVGGIRTRFQDVFGAEAPTLPPPVVELSATTAGQTLVKVSFTGAYAVTWQQLTQFRLWFDVRVAAGAIGEIETCMLLHTDGSTGEILGAAYEDSDQLAAPILLRGPYAKSNTVAQRVLFQLRAVSDLKVKGALDEGWVEEPLVGQSHTGGKLQYRITIENTGNAAFTALSVVDILPHVGDHAVLRPQSARGSDLAAYAQSDVLATVEPGGASVGVVLAYSESVDPQRFGPRFDVIGRDDTWSTQLPEDLSTLRAFRVQMKDRALAPGERLQILVQARLPVGADVGQVAFNSFAADIAYVDEEGQPQRLLAVEPEKVGVAVAPLPAGRGTISGYVWFDAERNGLYAGTEPLLNDIGVALLDAKGALVDAVFTAPDVTGLPGQFQFSNLTPGVYRLRFFPDDRIYKFTEQKAESASGSQVSQRSGETAQLVLSEETAEIRIQAGVVQKSHHSIEEIIAVNRSARAMVRDVVKNQMLLAMKTEDVLDLLEESLR